MFSTYRVAGHDIAANTLSETVSTLYGGSGA